MAYLVMFLLPQQQLLRAEHAVHSLQQHDSSELFLCARHTGLCDHSLLCNLVGCCVQGPSTSSKKLLTLGWFAPKFNFIPDIFSWRGTLAPSTEYQTAPNHPPESAEQKTTVPSSKQTPSPAPSPHLSPKPDQEPAQLNKPQHDNRPENEVESKTVNDDQKAEPKNDASGVTKAEVTDGYAASQAAAESPNGDAFAVSHAGVDSEGRVQAHGHVEVSCACTAVTYSVRS